MKKYVVIVAGGSGSRMNYDIPKQFIPIKDKPVLMHTIEAFRKYSEDIEIITVLPEMHIELWKELCDEYEFKIIHKVVIGGERRFDSVNNGLKYVPMDSIVAVHDGARPFVSLKLISKAFDSAEKHSNAIPAVPVYETVREVSGCTSKVVDRDSLRIIQTPQCFKADLLKKAYKQSYNASFTDDASVIDAMGVNINLIEGDFKNIKITRPVDLFFADTLMSI